MSRLTAILLLLGCPVFAQSQQKIYSYNSLIITEIMARPSANSGVPNSEYAEIFNPGKESIRLKDFKFSDPTRVVPLPDVVIEPGEYKVLIPRTRLADWAAYPREKIIDLSPWPTLNVGGDDLSILGPSNELVFFVSYSDTWYRDPFKALGGFSLEMIDTRFPCIERDNWRASDSPNGGTPTQENASSASNPDVTGPRLLRAVLDDPQTLRLFFDEKLDPIQALMANYQIEPSLGTLEVRVVEPQLNQVILWLEKSAISGVAYKITLDLLTDCAGNLIRNQANSSKFGLPLDVEPGDVVINEVLPNPRSGGVKFVEIYNRSQKLLSIRDWKLANLSNNAPANLRNLSPEHLLLEPGGFLVFTDNPAILKNEYPRGKQENFVGLASLPSYPQSAGNILLLDHRNRLLDQFSYDEKMHHRLVKDFKGVSLERISPSTETQNRDNWLSAAASEGYATPGYVNSQSGNVELAENSFFIEPKLIAPDSPNHPNFCSIHYQFPSGGNIINISIFDAFGRMVKPLVQNQIAGTEGFFVWDGTNEKGIKVKMGYYIAFFEVFNLEGKRINHKETIVVGSRLN